MKRLTALSCAYSLLVLCLLLARVHGAQSWSDWAKSAFVAHAKAPVDALEEYMTVKDNDDEAWKFSHGAITVSQDDGTSAHLEVGGMHPTGIRCTVHTYVHRAARKSLAGRHRGLTPPLEIHLPCICTSKKAMPYHLLEIVGPGPTSQLTTASRPQVDMPMVPTV